MREFIFLSLMIFTTPKLVAAKQCQVVAFASTSVLEMMKNLRGEALAKKLINNKKIQSQLQTVLRHMENPIDSLILNEKKMEFYIKRRVGYLRINLVKRGRQIYGTTGSLVTERVNLWDYIGYADIEREEKRVGIQYYTTNYYRFIIGCRL